MRYEGTRFLVWSRVDFNVNSDRTDRSTTADKTWFVRGRGSSGMYGQNMGNSTAVETAKCTTAVTTKCTAAGTGVVYGELGQRNSAASTENCTEQQEQLYEQQQYLAARVHIAEF
jgi:hypothetical protein